MLSGSYVNTLDLRSWDVSSVISHEEFHVDGGVTIIEPNWKN